LELYEELIKKKMEKKLRSVSSMVETGDLQALKNTIQENHQIVNQVETIISIVGIPNDGYSPPI
jgi:recombinational DNA repair protein (RecF pathway)